MLALRIIRRVWNINENGAIETIQNSDFLEERIIFALFLLFSYCHHFCFKDHMI